LSGCHRRWPAATFPRARSAARERRSVPLVLTTLLLAVALLLLAVALVLATLLLAVALLLLVVALVLATLLLVVALVTGSVETRVLVGVVSARLVALETWLLLGVEVLLVAAVLQLLRIYTELLQHAGVLLGVHLVHALQLLGSLLVVTAELANQVHD